MTQTGSKATTRKVEHDDPKPDNSESVVNTLALHDTDDESDVESNTSSTVRRYEEEEKRINEMKKAVQSLPQSADTARKASRDVKREPKYACMGESYIGRELVKKIKALEDDNLNLTLQMKKEQKLAENFRSQLVNEEVKNSNLENLNKLLEENLKITNEKAEKNAYYKLAFNRVTANYFNERQKWLEVCADITRNTGDDMSRICTIGSKSTEIKANTRVMTNELKGFMEGKIKKINVLDFNLEKVRTTKSCM